MSLRGCIGTFTSLSLHKGIKEYALTRFVSCNCFYVLIVGVRTLGRKTLGRKTLES